MPRRLWIIHDELRVNVAHGGLDRVIYLSVIRIKYYLRMRSGQSQPYPITAKPRDYVEGYKVMTPLILRFAQDERGATAIEYGLIAAILGVGIIVAAQALGAQISATFNSVAANMK
jgi:pilus assembly protein Flp/PilA